MGHMQWPRPSRSIQFRLRQALRVGPALRTSISSSTWSLNVTICWMSRWSTTCKYRGRSFPLVSSVEIVGHTEQCSGVSTSSVTGHCCSILLGSLNTSAMLTHTLPLVCHNKQRKHWAWLRASAKYFGAPKKWYGKGMLYILYGCSYLYL